MSDDTHTWGGPSMSESGNTFDGGDTPTPQPQPTDQVVGTLPTVPGPALPGHSASRRTFLKAAVIGSAAVAAASSAGAAALNLAAKKPGVIFRATDQVSGGGCSACIT